MKRLIITLSILFGCIIGMQSQTIKTVGFNNESNVEYSNVFLSSNDYISLSNYYSFSNEYTIQLTSMLYINFNNKDWQLIVIEYSDGNEDTLPINKLVNGKGFYLNRSQRLNLKEKFIKRIKCSDGMFNRISIPIDKGKALELNELANNLFKY